MNINLDSFMSFIRCNRMGYLELFHQEHNVDKTHQYEPEINHDSEMVKSFGRELFKGGVEFTNSTEVLHQISMPLKTPALIIYNPEITSSVLNLTFRDDILTLSERLNWLISFYSTTRIELPNHIYKTGFKLKVLKSMNISRKIELKIAYLNSNYERWNQIDIDKLFIVEDITHRATQNLVLIDRELGKIKILLETREIPKAKRGLHCIQPARCLFYNYCWSKQSKKSIYDIEGLTQNQISYLEDHNIDSIDQIPDDFKLSKVILYELRATIKNKPVIKRNKIKKWFDRIDSTAPLTFLNILVFKSPIPIVANSKPNEIMPYAYSMLYKRNAFSDLKKKQFIANKSSDPRLQFINGMVHDINSKGPIIVYDYKMTVYLLEKLVKFIPEYQETIKSIIERCWDLGAIIENRWYYHHSMEKKHDIISVLKSLDTSYKFQNTIIQNSKTASSYYRLLTGYPVRKELQITGSIKEFCNEETDAIYRVFDIFNSM